MHFYESSIITTKDGLHCQVYGNEHPLNSILVKPKYVPTDKLECDAFQYRFISGKRMNRLNLWADKEKLRKYILKFKATYPNYIYTSNVHAGDRLFFSVPIENIERIYFPRFGLSELMGMPEYALDAHLKLVYHFVKFLLQSGLKQNDIGITYSTLVGHYISNVSDINIVVYGKENYWLLMNYLDKTWHPLLRWKTKEEWLEFYKGRNRSSIFEEGNFIALMSRKRSEGYFDGTLFVIFAAEKEDEVWFKWGKEKYIPLGLATVECTVVNSFNSVVRPGCYDVTSAKLLSCENNTSSIINANTIINTNGNTNRIINAIDTNKIKKIVFYSHDYCMLAQKEEMIRACGILERVEPEDNEPYYRLVVGYFDAYLTDRREKEYIRVVKNE